MSATRLRHRLLEWVRWRRELGTVDGVVLTVGTRQDPGFIADITLDPDDPNAWVSSHDDVSSDATPSGAFLSEPNPPCCTRHRVSAHKTSVSRRVASSSVSPSLFAPPSRAPTFKRREQDNVHNPAISASIKGVVEHSPLSREDEGHADPEERDELRHR
ncbi:hypothetical protein V8E53_005772 [Lactarius tabidus]